MPDFNFQERHAAFSAHYSKMAALHKRQAAPQVLEIGQELDEAVANFVIAVSQAFSRLEDTEIVQDLRRHANVLDREGAPTLAGLCYKAADRIALLEAAAGGEAVTLLRAILNDINAAEELSDVVGKYVSTEHYARAGAFIQAIGARR